MLILGVLGYWYVSKSGAVLQRIRLNLLGLMLYNQDKQRTYIQSSTLSKLQSLKMELIKLVTIIVFAASLAFQAINLAAQGKAYTTYKDADTLAGTTTSADSNAGYTHFVIAASAISCGLYIYLIIVKLTDKSPSPMVDWIISHLAIIFQFAIATVLAVNLRNTKTAYDTNMSALAVLEALGTTGPTVNLLKDYRTVHNLSIAAAVLDYIVCFGAGLFVLAWNAKNSQDQKVQGTAVKADTTLNQINV